MAHLLAGNDIKTYNPDTELGKGCREPAKKSMESDSELDDVCCFFTVR